SHRGLRRPGGPAPGHRDAASRATRGDRVAETPRDVAEGRRGHQRDHRRRPESCDTSRHGRAAPVAGCEVMTPDTADLIHRIAAAGAPARPLAPPWTRAGIWCALSLPSLWLLYLVWPHAEAAVLFDRRFAIEQAAALATGLGAAAAA